MGHSRGGGNLNQAVDAKILARRRVSSYNVANYFDDPGSSSTAFFSHRMARFGLPARAFSSDIVAASYGFWEHDHQGPDELLTESPAYRTLARKKANGRNIPI